MKLRAWPFPRTVSDWGTTIFLFFCMPCVYWFELWIVRPEFWPPDSFLYIFNFFLATFILFNVISNMMAVMMCNTSIVGEKIIRPAKSNSSLWKFCSVCETVVPPRAWHCQTCRVCILKRDHHCMFTGCCIGHHNQRYFIYLVFYVFVGTTYASVLNTIFIWYIRGEEFRTLITCLKIVFPLAMFMVDASISQYYLLMYLLNMIGSAFTGFLLYFHLRNVWRGCVTNEAIRQFDLGPLENIRMVFGKRWYLTWLSPFITSELPLNGCAWQSVYDKTSKNL